MSEDLKSTASDQAYEQIRSQILTGRLEQGKRLTEQELARDLGLSRTPVRDAIKKLTHEGFITKGAGYSTHVAYFPEDELTQIFEIRRRLESYAARRAAEHATEAQSQQLQKLAMEMLRHIPPESSGDYQKIATLNEEFHRIIGEAARSPRLLAVVSMAIDISVVSRTYHQYTTDDLMRSAQHHKEIADAIAARSPQWAESVMSSHILAAATVARAQHRE